MPKRKTPSLLKKEKISLPTYIFHPVDIKGDVKIGVGCIVHPNASIHCEKGCRITIGDYNIIEVNLDSVIPRSG